MNYQYMKSLWENEIVKKNKDHLVGKELRVELLEEGIAVISMQYKASYPRAG